MSTHATKTEKKPARRPSIFKKSMLATRVPAHVIETITEYARIRQTDEQSALAIVFERGLEPLREVINRYRRTLDEFNLQYRDSDDETTTTPRGHARANAAAPASGGD